MPSSSFPKFQSNNELINFIKENSNFINKYNDENKTPLSLAVLSDDYVMLEFLLRNVAKIDKPNGDGSTPLTIAILKKKFNMVELLLQHGADVNAPGIKGMKPLTVAKDTGDESIIKLLETYQDKDSLKPTFKYGIYATIYEKYQEEKVYKASPNREIKIFPKCAFYKTKGETEENNNSPNAETNNPTIKP